MAITYIGHRPQHVPLKQKRRMMGTTTRLMGETPTVTNVPKACGSNGRPDKREAVDPVRPAPACRIQDAVGPVTPMKANSQLRRRGRRVGYEIAVRKIQSVILARISVKDTGREGMVRGLAGVGASTIQLLVSFRLDDHWFVRRPPTSSRRCLPPRLTGGATVEQIIFSIITGGEIGACMTGLLGVMAGIGQVLEDADDLPPEFAKAYISLVNANVTDTVLNNTYCGSRWSGAATVGKLFAGALCSYAVTSLPTDFFMNIFGAKVFSLAAGLVAIVQDTIEPGCPKQCITNGTPGKGAGMCPEPIALFCA